MEIFSQAGFYNFEAVGLVLFLALRGILFLDVSVFVVGGGGEVEAIVLVLLEGGFVRVEGIDEEANVASAQVIVSIGFVIVALLIAIAAVVSCVSIAVITAVPISIIPAPIVSVIAVVAIVISIAVISVVISIAVIGIVILVLVEGLKVLFVGFVRVLAPVNAFPFGILAHGFQRGHVFRVIEIVDVVILHRQGRCFLGHGVPVSVPCELAVVSGHILAFRGHQGLPLLLIHIFLVVAEPVPVHEVVEHDQPDHRKDDNQ